MIKKILKKILPEKIWRLLRHIKHHPQVFQKGWLVLKEQGIKGVWEKLKKISSPFATSPTSYCYNEPDFTEEISHEIRSFHKSPLISIIMPVYNVEPEWLKNAIMSIDRQWYSNWELCIADDASTNHATIEYLKKIKHPKIKIKFLEMNLNISGASNAAMSLAKGEYIALVDNDDELTPDALYEVVKAINAHDPDFIYSDEDKIDDMGNYFYPFFKPDYSYDLLLSSNYLCHLSVFKKSLFEEELAFREGFEGAQDYDLFLRIIEKTDRIHHIPKVLYHWRLLYTSTSFNPDSKPQAHINAHNALTQHLQRSKIDAIVEESTIPFTYSIRYNTLNSKTLVSIIIPTKDGLELLKNCISSIFEKSTYTNFEIIILNNNSVQQETFDWFESIQAQHSNVRVIEANYEFNWSRLNNHGISEANGEAYIFLNNDIEVISPDWIERLAENALRNDIGSVGALLLFEDNTIQHAGVVLGMGDWADHVYRGEPMEHLNSPYVSPLIPRNVLASTGACLCISKKTIDTIGLFDETFKICGSDVEISLRAYEKGLKNLYNANAKLYHYESKTRDSFIPQCDFEMSEKAYKEYWKSGDPYYNKNLNLNKQKPEVLSC